MTRWFKRIALALVAALVAAQFIPLKKTNPPVDPSKTMYASLPVPANVQNIFERSCKDCHSNETAWPWYSHVAPVSWAIVSDVHGGRAELNLSEWDTYNAKRKDRKFKEICDQLTSGEMPDVKYTSIHRDARLTDTERTAVCQWAEATRKAQAAAPATPAASTDPAVKPASAAPAKAP